MAHPKHITALVTGGTRRVGLAIAKAFAASGPATLILTSRNPQSAEAAAARKELEGLGAQVHLERFDPGQPQDAPDLASRLIVRGGIDALVHNASIYEATPLASMQLEDLDRHMRVNAFAPASLTIALRPALERSDRPGGAGVVAIADMHALGRPRKGLLAYNASKAALIEIVRSLARELAPRIRVNAVAPGVIQWPDEGPEAGEEFRADYLKRVPLARAGTPADGAEAVRWLALDAAYTTGEILRVDGGRWLA